MKKAVDKKMTEWNDTERNSIASTLREISRELPYNIADWLCKLALSIDNN